MGDVGGPQWQSPLFDVCKIRRNRPLGWRERKTLKERERERVIQPSYSLDSFTLYEDTFCILHCDFLFLQSIPAAYFILSFDTEFIVIPDSLRVAYAASSLPIATDSALPYPCAIGSGFLFNQEIEGD